MTVVRKLAHGQSAWQRAFRLGLTLMLVVSFLGIEAAAPPSSIAAPNLSVDVSVSKPLLGGKSTITITATNTGDVKGYNLSFDALLSSGMVDPNGRVRVVDHSEAPTSVQLDSATGDTTVVFYDLVDLAPGESHTVTLEVTLDGDSSWEVGELLKATISGRLNEIPDNSGEWITGSATAEAEVIPVDLVRKTANQSTSVHQATGTGERGYSYTLEAQNNYTNPSQAVVIEDALPDGVEFLGMQAGPALDAGYPMRDPQTGITRLRWTLGDMAPGEREVITYGTGIRYDYYGTDNGGTNRPHGDFSTPPTTGIIPNKTGFSNTATLTGRYQGSLPAPIDVTDSESASVQGAYVTVNKSATPETGGHGTIVTYTLTFATSEYYRADGIVIHDILPDGLTYVGPLDLAPTSVTPNADGTTDIIWENVPDLDTAETGSIRFQARVDEQWESPGIAGQPIRAGDSMRNVAEMAATWHDEVTTTRTERDELVASVDAGLTTGLPPINKQVWDPQTSTWVDSIDARVGDTLRYRVRLNTSNGSTPLRTDLVLGDITLTDWLPPGTVYNGDASPSFNGTFELPETGSPHTIDPVNPTNVTIGTLKGLQWYLGDVSPGGWWETEFTVTVVDNPIVQEGLRTGNHWKLTGRTTEGKEYSDRDIAELNYVEPHLVLDKAVVSAPDPLLPGSVVNYSVTIENTGNGTAEDVLITDTLPVGMRTATPAITSITLGGTALVSGADYTSSYTASTGVWTIDLHTSSIDTPIPSDAKLVINYNSTVDQGVGAGATLRDIATVGYNSQPDGSGRAVPGTNNTSDPNTDDATVSLAPLKITKNWPAGPYTVGQTFPVSIDVEVPPGMVAYRSRIVDTFNRDGAYYVPDSATLSTVNGTPVTPAAFGASSTPTRGATTSNNSTTLTWDLASPISNVGQASAYTFRLSFSLLYTGVRDNGTQEFWIPTANDRITNTSAQVLWGTASSGSARDVNANYNPPNIRTDIDQPLLELDKTLTTSGPYAGGDTIGYQVVIRNAGWSAAYDLDWDDVLPAYVYSPTLVSVVNNAGTSILSNVTPDFTTTTPSIDFGNVSLAPGQTITIRYTATIDENVPAGTTLTNRADVDWSSLPGTPAGSRRYDDQEWESNYTRDTDSETITVASPSIVKTILGPNPARIGDVVEYRLRVTVPPETVLPNSYLTDLIGAEGTSYVADSAAITHVSGTPETAAVLGTVAFDDATPSPGATLRFNLAQPIDNSSAAAVVGDAPYVFDLTYKLKVDGLDDAGGWAMFVPTATDRVPDAGRLHWTVSGTERTVESRATLDVDQPLLRLVKSELSTGPYEGGDTVRYRTVVTNVGWAAAHNVTWEDVFAPQLSNATLVSVMRGTDDITSSVTADFTGAPSATIDFGSLTLAPGQSVIVEYTLTVDPGAGSGSSQTNTADVDWTSLPDASDGRVYNDSPNEADWTDDTDTVTVYIAEAGLTKTVVGGDLTRTIGEEFEYEVTFSVPPRTTAYKMVLEDVVPDGLTVLSATRSLDIGTLFSGPEAADGTTPVIWDLGMVTNPPVSELTLTMRVRVDDTFADGTPLDGLPAAIDGDGQTTLLNAAELTWDDALVGGTTHTSEDDVTVTVEEPHLTIEKTADRSTLGALDEAVYTVTIENTGRTSAYGVKFDDVIEPELFSAGSSPKLVSVSLDGTALTAGTDYTADFGTSATSSVVLSPAIPAGSSVEIVYSATLAGGVAAGVTLPNTARVSEYRSLPESETGARVYAPISDDASLTTLAPAIEIAKSTIGDQQLQRGQEAKFRITVENTGNAAGYAIGVADVLPDGLTYVTGSTNGTLPGIGTFTGDPVVVGSTLTWDFGGDLDLAVGGTATFEFRALVAEDAVLGTLTNNANATIRDAALVPVDLDTGSSTVLITDPRVSLIKSLAAGQDTHVQVGGQVTFDLVVENTGNTSLSTVPLTDTFDAAYLRFSSATIAPSSTSAGTLTWNDLTGAGALAPGGKITVSVTFDVIGHPATSSTINRASVPGGATDEYGDKTPPVDSEAEIGITAPAVSVTKELASGHSGTVSIGGTVTFGIRVTNSGDTTLTAIALSETFDPDVWSFVSATPTPGSTTPAGTLAWAELLPGATELAPGESVDVTVTVRALAAAVDSVDTATVTSATDVNGDSAGTDDDTAQATVVEPRLTIEKSADRTIAEPGELVSYTVTLRNEGTGPAHDAVVVDSIPVPLWPVTLGAVELDGVALTNGTDYTFLVKGASEVELIMLVPVPAGSTLELTYTAKIAGGTAGALDLENIVSATYTSLPGDDPDETTYGPITDTWTITSREPDLSVDKTVLGDVHLQRGQTSRYRVVLTNDGDAVAYAATITDTLPDGLSYVAGSSVFEGPDADVWSAEPAVVGQTVTWNLPLSVLQSGESLSVEFSVLVAEDAEPGAKVNGVVARAVDGGGGERGPAESSAESTVTVPSIKVDKSLAAGQDTHIQVGETVTFDIVVTNDGTTAITTLPLSDTYDPTYLRFESASIIPSAVTSGTVSWNDLTGPGSLAVGDSITVTLEFTAVAHPANSTTVDTARASGVIDEHDDPAPDASDEGEIAITAPSIEVTKDFADTERSVYQLGEEIDFEIVVTNTGDTTIASLPLSDTYDPARLEFVRATPSVDTTVSGRLEWNDVTASLGDIAPGASVRLTVTFVAIGTGNGENVAAVEDGAPADEFGDPVPGGSDTRPFGVYEPSQVSFDKTADPAANTQVDPGSTITYTLTFKNSSAVSIPQVEIVDEVPSAVDYSAGSLTLDTGNGPVSLTDAADDDAGTFVADAGPRGTVRFAAGDVAPGATVTATFKVVVRDAADSRAGVRNQASVSGAGVPITRSEVVDHSVDPLDITKTARDVNGGKLKPGDDIEWTIVVSNHGLIPATRVVVKDNVPEHTTYVAGSITGQGADDSGSPALVWNVGTLEPGASVTLTFKSRVNAKVPPRTQIRNQAVVTSDQSASKYSDAPETTDLGDPTLLQTGGNDWIWISVVAALLAAAAALWAYSRKLQRSTPRRRVRHAATMGASAPRRA